MRLPGHWLMTACLLLAAVAPPLSAGSGAPAAAEPLESIVITHVDGWIDFSPAGQAVGFQTDANLLPALRENLERTARNWRIEPILIDGTPRQVRAKTRVVLAATRLGDKYSVKVDNVTFPTEPNVAAGPIDGSPAPISGQKLRPPRYPFELMQANVSGRALICIRVGADGSAEEVVAVQTMLFDVKGKERNLRKAIELMEKSAVSAAKSWRFNISAERGRMSAKERTVRVPVEYFMGRKPVVETSGLWRTVVRVPMRTVGWVPESAESQKVGVTDVAAGEIQPATSVVKLDTNVVGTIVM